MQLSDGSSVFQLGFGVGAAVLAMRKSFEHYRTTVKYKICASYGLLEPTGSELAFAERLWATSLARRMFQNLYNFSMLSTCIIACLSLLGLVEGAVKPGRDFSDGIFYLFAFYGLMVTPACVLVIQEMPERIAKSITSSKDLGLAEFQAMAASSASTQQAIQSAQASLMRSDKVLFRIRLESMKRKYRTIGEMIFRPHRAVRNALLSRSIRKLIQENGGSTE